MQYQSSLAFVEKAREEVTHYSDVVLPKGCEMAASVLLQSQPEGTTVTCRTLHGMAMRENDPTMPRMR